MENAGGDGNGGGFGGPEEGLYRLSSVGEEVRIREPSCPRSVHVLLAFGSHVCFISFSVARQFCMDPADSGGLVRGAIRNIVLWAAKGQNIVEFRLSSVVLPKLGT